VLVAFLLSGFVLSSPLRAQDPVFSQYTMTPLQLNPGLAGLSGNASLTAAYRNQFPGFNNAYTTYMASWDQYFKNINSGAGFWLLADDAGDGLLKTLKAALVYSIQLQLGRDFYTRLGAEAAFVQTSLNRDRLRFGDQIDDAYGTISPGGIPYPTEEIAPGKNTVMYPDVGMGLVVYGRELYAGMSMRHLNRPSPDFLNINTALSEGIPMRWVWHAGGVFQVFRGLFSRSADVRISPSVIFVQQGVFNQINGGVLFDAGMVSFGLNYRLASGNSEAIIGSIGLRTNKLRIGYSFDYTISGFPLSGGTHEIGIAYKVIDGSREPAYNDCLQIFR